MANIKNEAIGGLPPSEGIAEDRYFLDWQGVAVKYDAGLNKAWIPTEGLTEMTKAEYLERIAPTQEQIEAKRSEIVAAIKAERTARLESLSVEYGGVIYDADETSQTRMARAIAALPEGETISWRARDNLFYSLGSNDLRSILALAGVKQTELWVEYAEKEAVALNAAGV
jgi:hypothetical protein